ncbi:MAG: peptide ABC transporter substrate-binding protein, partial [Francisellaceae bacterium]|nr:peptide ABC transporter substrate-binding protein [Francisellaceae bacterium]
IKKGTGQIFFWGWNADYPDVENFLFMFYSKNSKVKHGGENAVNYHNNKFDELFEKYNLAKSPEGKQNLVEKMINVVQDDSPWVWGYHPHTYTLYHEWYSKSKPNSIARNTIKYIDIDPIKRDQMQRLWNKANYVPLVITLLITIGCIILSACFYYRRQLAKVKRML